MAVESRQGNYSDNYAPPTHSYCDTLGGEGQPLSDAFLGSLNNHSVLSFAAPREAECEPVARFPRLAQRDRAYRGNVDWKKKASEKGSQQCRKLQGVHSPFL